MHVHVTVSIDQEQLWRFDEWWKAGDFKSRSEALAYLIKRALPDDGKEPNDY